MRLEISLDDYGLRRKVVEYRLEYRSQYHPTPSGTSKENVPESLNRYTISVDLKTISSTKITHRSQFRVTQSYKVIFHTSPQTPYIKLTVRDEAQRIGSYD